MKRSNRESWESRKSLSPMIVSARHNQQLHAITMTYQVENVGWADEANV